MENLAPYTRLVFTLPLSVLVTLNFLKLNEQGRVGRSKVYSKYVYTKEFLLKCLILLQQSNQVCACRGRSTCKPHAGCHETWVLCSSVGLSICTMKVSLLGSACSNVWFYSVRHTPGCSSDNAGAVILLAYRRRCRIMKFYSVAHGTRNFIFRLTRHRFSLTFSAARDLSDQDT